MGKTSQLMNVQIVEREEGRGGRVGRGEGDRETERGVGKGDLNVFKNR